jgi:hypothetical protein
MLNIKSVSIRCETNSELEGSQIDAQSFPVHCIISTRRSISSILDRLGVIPFLREQLLCVLRLYPVV